jgi:hypothetical protein
MSGQGEVSAMDLWLVSITIGRASEFITNHDRPHSPPAGAQFALGITDGDGHLLGVAIAGRPVPPARDDGTTVEITRSASSMDGSSHVEIALYRAVWRVARAEGYRRLITHSQLGDVELGLREIGLRPAAALPPRDCAFTPWRARTDRGVDGARRTRWEPGSITALSPGGAGPLRALWPTAAVLVDVVGGQPVRLGRPCPAQAGPCRASDQRRRAA